MTSPGSRMTTTDTPKHFTEGAWPALMGLTVRSDEEIARMDLQDRRSTAGDILGRLPRFVREPSPALLLNMVHHAKLSQVALTWKPEQGNLVLLGRTGAGKSTAAAYCFRRVLGRGVTFGGEAWKFAQRLRWYAGTDLERARLEHKLGVGEAPEITAACNASLLVIDDAGWVRSPDAVSAVLADRYESGRITIITAESRETLVEKYGAAVVRRLFESGGSGRTTLVEAA